MSSDEKKPLARIQCVPGSSAPGPEPEDIQDSQDLELEPRPLATDPADDTQDDWPALEAGALTGELEAGALGGEVESDALPPGETCEHGTSALERCEACELKAQRLRSLFAGMTFGGGSEGGFGGEL